jgi:hypothetical protein
MDRMHFKKERLGWIYEKCEYLREGAKNVKHAMMV